MIAIGGLLFTLVCVFGGFALSGGSVSAVMNALPFELLTICGAAIGSFLMANSIHIVKATLSGMKSVLGGTRREMPPPVETMEGLWSQPEENYVRGMLRYAVVGAPATVRAGLGAILEETEADDSCKQRRPEPTRTVSGEPLSRQPPFTRRDPH